MTTEERNRAIRNTIDEVRARLRPEDTGISSRLDTNYVGADVSDEEAAEFVEALNEENIVTESGISIDPESIITDATGLCINNDTVGKCYIRRLTTLDSKPLMLDLIKKAIEKELITSKDILMLFNEVKHDDS